MKQDNNAPLSTAEVACILMVIEQDLFDKIPIDKIHEAERELLTNLRTRHKDLLHSIEKNPVYETYFVDKLKAIVESLMPVFTE